VGSNDWISSNVVSAGTLTSVLSGATPGFASASDLHLTASSPVLGAGLPGASAVDGSGAAVSGVPDQEFSGSLGTTPRAAGSTLDLGAYGFPRASDAGTPDAGLPDGGAPPDPGIPDGGAGLGEGGVTGSCSSAGGGTPGLALAMIVVLLSRRRSLIG